MNKPEDLGYVIVYSKLYVPDGMTVQEVFDIIEKENKCYFDSRKGGSLPPTVIHLGGDKNSRLRNLEIIDTALHIFPGKFMFSYN